jgi:uncharacterized protein YecE (DUF72 family)
MPPRYHLGTMGFGYPEWRGVLYPKGTKSSGFLAHYAQVFDAVELDTTFHAAPDRARVRRWAAAVPDGFCFAAKVPRAITHDAPLDRGAAGLLDFLSVMSDLGPKLGPVLIQLAPSLPVAALPRLAALISKVPTNFDLAVEFRHPSWWETEETARLLRDYRAAWVWADYGPEPRELHATADFAFVRWIGQHDRYPAKNRLEADLSARLRWWKEELSHRAAHARAVYGFFNNDYAGYAVESCRQFQAMLGLPATAVPATGLFSPM